MTAAAFSKVSLSDPSSPASVTQRRVPTKWTIAAHAC
jgi:hypothetical protein